LQDEEWMLAAVERPRKSSKAAPSALAGAGRQTSGSEKKSKGQQQKEKQGSGKSGDKQKQ